MLTKEFAFLPLIGRSRLARIIATEAASPMRTVVQNPEALPRACIRVLRCTAICLAGISQVMTVTPSIRPLVRSASSESSSYARRLAPCPAHDAMP